MEDPKSTTSKNDFSEKYQPLKKLLPQLLLYLSIFSFLLSYSSRLYSPSSIHLLTQALNKNYLFLICNGLLVFVAKSSGLIRPPSGYDLNDAVSQSQKLIGDDRLQLYASFEPKEISIDESSNLLSNVENEISENPEEVQIAIAESEEEKKVDDDSRSFWIFDDPVAYVEEEEENTEELNQKFEDFIRRMKKEIMVNDAAEKEVMAD